jgi:EmrB/QacA subfamily drug resistance transporter
LSSERAVSAHGIVPTHHREPSDGTGTRKGWVLAAMSLGFTMTMIDATIVTVALPTIQRDLDLSNTDRVWIVNAYLLVLAVSIALAGRFSDVIGSRKVFLTGLGIFTVMSATCGLAAGTIMLLASRAVQGLGSALMTPTSQAVVTNTFPQAERGKALGIYAGVSAVGVALGPVLGGALTEFISWRAIFFVNVPIGIATWLLTRYARPPETEARREPLDWVGTALLVVGLGSVIIALMQAQNWGGIGSAAFLTVFISGVALLILFAVVELRSRMPLLELRIFKNRNFLGDSLVMTIMRFSLFGMSVYTPIFTQDVLGFSAFEAGLAGMPSTIMLFITSPWAGRLYDRVGARVLITAGILSAAVAFAWFAAFAFPKQSYAWMVPALVLAGVGIGLIQSPALTDAMNAAPARMRGQAAGILGTTQQIGATFGVGVITAILTPLFLTNLVANLNSVGIQATQEQVNERILAEAGGGASFSPQEIEAAKAAFSSALATSYWLIVGLLLVALLVTLLLVRRQ